MQNIKSRQSHDMKIINSNPVHHNEIILTLTLLADRNDDNGENSSEENVQIDFTHNIKQKENVILKCRKSILRENL